MGYSLSVRAHTVELAERMGRFFERRSRFPEIIGALPVFPCPFYHYDSEPQLVLERSLIDVPERLHWCCVDSLGITLLPPADLEFEVEDEARERARTEAQAAS